MGFQLTVDVSARAAAVAALKQYDDDDGSSEWDCRLVQSYRPSSLEVLKLQRC